MADASPTAIVTEEDRNNAVARTVKPLPCARATFAAPTTLSIASIYAQFLESESQRWLQTKGDNFQMQQLPLPLREEINRLSLLTSHFKSRSTSSSSSPVATSEDLLFASASSSLPLISVIMPVHNSMPYLVATIFSVMYQTYRPLEICIYDDFSRDDSRATLESLRSLLLSAGGHIELKIDSAEKRGFDAAKGAGFARNRAMELAKGEFFAFQDSDDLSLPLRFEKQYHQFLKEKDTLVAQQLKTDALQPSTTDSTISISDSHPLILLGCHLERLPLDSTPRWTRWINSLSDSTSLFNHAFREITLPCPTWFTSRYTFDKVGNFQEVLGEDMHFFYKSFLAASGTLSTIPSTEQNDQNNNNDVSSNNNAGPLLVYRNHASNLSGRTPFSYLFSLRVSALESMVLRGGEDSSIPTRFPKFAGNQGFTIWNAGKAGKHLYRGLSPETRARVKAFCDIDPKKIGRGVFEDFDDATRRVIRKIPIISWEHATAPAIICVRQEVEEDESQREFRHRIEVVKGWKEGIDYFFLS